MAAYGFYHIIFSKFPPAHQSFVAPFKYNDHAISFKIGQFIGFYVPPFVIAIGGWLLLKFGIEKVNAASEETANT